MAIHKNAINDVDAYLTMLLDLNNMGALMRNVMTSALTNPQKYRGLMDPLAFAGKSEYDSYCQDSNKIYQDAVKSLPNPEPPDEYKGEIHLSKFVKKRTFKFENIINIKICLFAVFVINSLANDCLFLFLERNFDFNFDFQNVLHFKSTLSTQRSWRS